MKEKASLPTEIRGLNEMFKEKCANAMNVDSKVVDTLVDAILYEPGLLSTQCIDTEQEEQSKHFYILDEPPSSLPEYLS